VRHVASKGYMSNTSHTTLPLEEILDESELAVRLKTSVASVRWMRRTGRISFIKIAGNRKVRFRWPQVLEDLRASEVRASVHDDERARQLADIANENDDDAAECAAADLSREFPGSPA
jgi:hypothetical protein